MAHPSGPPCDQATASSKSATLPLDILDRVDKCDRDVILDLAVEPDRAEIPLLYEKPLKPEEAVSGRPLLDIFNLVRPVTFIHHCCLFSKVLN